MASTFLLNQRLYFFFFFVKLLLTLDLTIYGLIIVFHSAFNKLASDAHWAIDVAE